MTQVFKASELFKVGNTSRIRPSGILPLDIASGIGGWRSSMFVEIFGPESSGKTLIALLSAIHSQKIYNEKSLLVDAEFAWDPSDEKKISYQVEWFKKLGGNPDLLEIVWPEYSEDVYKEIITEHLPSNEYAYLIIDSWKAMVPKAIIEKDPGDKKKGAYGEAAKVNAEFIQAAMPVLFHKSNTTILVVNHESIDPDIKFGDPTTSPGGKLLKFYSKQRIQTSAPTRKRDSNSTTIKGFFRKNKVSKPYVTFDFPINFDTGLDRGQMLYTMGMICDVIKGGQGGIYYYKDSKFSKGKENLIYLLNNDVILAGEIENDIKNIYKPTIETGYEGVE